MEDITLKKYLDDIGAKEGDNSGFVLQEDLFSRTEMYVSRRYLECETWKHLLEKKVLTAMPFTDMYGRETVKIILK